MIFKDFEIDTTKEIDSVAYLSNDIFEIYFDGFTLKKKCTVEEVKQICIKNNIEFIWG